MNAFSPSITFFNSWCDSIPANTLNYHHYPSNLQHNHHTENTHDNNSFSHLFNVLVQTMVTVHCWKEGIYAESLRLACVVLSTTTKKDRFLPAFCKSGTFFFPSTLAANFIQIPFNAVKASAYLLHIKLSSIPPQYQSHHNFNSYYKKSYMTPAKRQTITSSAAGENGTPHCLVLVQYTKTVQGFDRTHQSW